MQKQPINNCGLLEQVYFLEQRYKNVHPPSSGLQSHSQGQTDSLDSCFYTNRLCAVPTQVRKLYEWTLCSTTSPPHPHLPLIFCQIGKIQSEEGRPLPLSVCVFTSVSMKHMNHTNKLWQKQRWLASSDSSVM